ncbi:nucleotidyltransferase family protein, partial [Candidatus Woesearchaeota archaeon]|nr:nucleotidyltransferase family protein [Candidatus Woesearchaeota archaeon]
MKALILAAGYGTRLYPLTTLTSKSLLRISGKPLVEHILMRIEEVPGIDEVLIVTNNRFFPDFRNWLNSYKAGVKVRLINDRTSSNEDRLGAVGDIHFVVSSEGIDDGLLVIAGDNLFEFSLPSMHRFFRGKMASVVALHDLKDPGMAAGKFGIAEVDGDLRIVGFEEKPSSPKSSLA